MTGDLYELRATFAATPDARHTNTARVGLDICAGCNLIRRNQLPYGVAIRSLSRPNRVSSAQGQNVKVLGEVTLTLRLEESTDTMDVEFLVVEALVVPALLGTPWINRYVWSIDPPKRSVLIHIDDSKEPFRSPLTSSPARTHHPVRVSSPQTLPPFSETWVSCNSQASGLSLIRPSRRRDRLIQVKNGVKSLPPHRETFLCLVANFSDTPKEIVQGQVIGEAESVSLWPEGKIEQELRKEAKDGDEWEVAIRQSVPHLTTEQADRLIETLIPHADMWDGKLGRISAVKHHIITSGPPIASQPYRAGPSSRTLIDAEVQRMLDMDVIEPSSGPWSAPVVLIPKPDGSIRFCIDYRKLNAVTTNDSYALPRVDDCLDSLGDARYFTTLDANCGYWQIDVNEADREKTAFTSHKGLFQFKRMPFGLMTAPATFQRAIDVVLSSVRFQCALTYLDDIVIYSPTFDQHLLDLARVLQLLRDAGVSLKRAKCSFAALQVKYLGLKVGQKGVEVDEEKLVSVRQALPPTNKTGLRRFLGMTGFYRKFIPSYAKVAAPLTKYLKGDRDETFELDADALQAHADLKLAITSAPVLALPNKDGAFVLETDASAAQLGVQLLQTQPDGSYRPLGYWSRHCTPPELNYSPTEREALAIVWGIKKCRPYLERTRFVVRSDHQALRWLFSTTSTDGNPRVVRWKLALAAYNFSVEYKPGASHKVPDELSRMITLGHSDPPTEDEDSFVPCLVVDTVAEDKLLPTPVFPRASPLIQVPEALDAISLEDMLEAQATDTWCESLYAQLEEGIRPTKPPGLSIDEYGLLVCAPVDEDLPLRRVVPSSLRDRLCTLAHYTRVSGHPGATKLMAALSREWFWPSMARDCVAVVRSCPACVAKRLKRGPKRSVPLTIFPPIRPLEFVAIDVLGPLPTTSRGNRFVLCMTDRFSKMSVAVPLPEQTASVVAQTLVDRWISVFGIPVTLLSDNGSAFASKFFGVLTQVLGVKQVFTSAYRPTTNGQVERWNATLVDAIAMLAFEKDWDLSVGLACVAYNSTVHTTTGYAPIELSSTRDPCPNVWTRQPSLSSKTVGSKNRLRHQLLERAAKFRDAAIEKTHHRLARYKEMYDLHVRKRHGSIQLGDSVFVRTHVIEPARSPKLSFPVAGPYPIVGISGSNVDIRTREGSQRVHLDRVVRCPTDLPSGVSWVPHRVDPPKTKKIARQREDADMYVIDRLISHARADDDSCWLVRVRWAAYGSDDDTWEPAMELPEELVRRYERRKKLPNGLLTRPEPPVIDRRPLFYEPQLPVRNLRGYDAKKPFSAQKGAGSVLD